MKKSIVFLSLFTSCIYGAPLSQLPFPMEYGLHNEEPKEIVINNRVLFKINGKVITVMDVVKRMDLLFHQRFPEMSDNPLIRYQFFLVNWEHMLQSCINDQLMLADATEKKIEVTDGDVREEMEKLLGPDVVLNIEEMGMKFDEVFEMLKTELTVRKLTNMTVKAKAIQEVTPQSVRKAYGDFSQVNPPKEIWRYQVLSIRGQEPEKTLAVAERAKKLVAEDNIPFAELLSHLESEDSSLQIKLSEVLERSEKELSTSHKTVLQVLTLAKESLHLMHNTKKEGEAVTQLFYLQGHAKEETAPLAEVEQKLQNELIQKEIARYSEEYLERLYRYYGFKEDYLSQMIPKDFIPFTLR